MATFSALTKAFFCLQLLLFVSSNVSAQDMAEMQAEPPIHHKGHREHHKHHYPPAHPPSLPPSKPPVPPATEPPVKPPIAPPVKPYPSVKPPVHLPVPRSFLAIEGVVYCKPTCQYAGVDTLWGAEPLPGATVRIICKNTRVPLDFTAQTDGHGYFHVEAPVTKYGIRSCRVKLLSSPSPKCPIPGPLHRGNTGSRIHPEKFLVDPKRGPYVLFSVGPFAFEPKCYKN